MNSATRLHNCWVSHSQAKASIASFRLSVSDCHSEIWILQPSFPASLRQVPLHRKRSTTVLVGGYRTRAALSLKNFCRMPNLLGRPTQIRRNATATITIPLNKFVGVFPKGKVNFWLRNTSIRPCFPSEHSHFRIGPAHSCQESS